MKSAMFVLLLLVPILGCQALPDVEEKNSDLGPRLGLKITGGYQKTSNAKDELKQPAYTEGAMGYGLAVYELAWGFRADAIFFEPIFFFGSGGGMVDNGAYLAANGAEFDDYEGGVVGAGFKSRISLLDTLVRVGLDAKYLRFTGESDLKVDNNPNIIGEYDSETKHLEILIVADYNDPHYRPFLAGGISGFFNEFENHALASKEIEMDPRRPFGIKGGIDFINIANTGVYSGIELGYFGGAQISLSVGYRF